MIRMFQKVVKAVRDWFLWRSIRRTVNRRSNLTWDE